jgi:phosphoribosylformylglycinamidine (FGAM) synthase PurS component
MADCKASRDDARDVLSNPVIEEYRVEVEG